MSFVNCANHESLSLKVAEIIMSRMQHADPFRIGLATGFSPSLTYKFIAEALNNRPELRSRIQGYQIDEWMGLAPDNTSSCQYAVRKEVCIPWQLHPDQCVLIDGNAQHMKDHIKDLAKKFSAHPLDLCVLGIGQNGHLALNEPGTSIDATFGLRILESHSQGHEMLKATTQSVTEGITIGLHEILASKEILLLITGQNKREAYHQMRNRIAIDQLPASAIYMHDNWQCLVNGEAVL